MHVIYAVDKIFPSKISSANPDNYPLKATVVTQPKSLSVFIRKLLLLTLTTLTFVCAGYAQVPVASITASPISGCPPLAVSFNASGTNSPTGWSWTFAGGAPSSSTMQNPAVIFNNPGIYIVTLIAKNASGNSSPVTTQITVNPSPTADFTQNKTTGCAPTYVLFTNSSTAGTGATIKSYSWSFGDGTQDTAASPNHRFTIQGSFPVTLYVKNNFGCQGSAQIKNVQKAITLSGLVVPNFSNTLNSSCTLPVTANFVNTSTGPTILSYLWDFGDGSPKDNTISPSHNYTIAGNYTATLAVTSNQGCSDTLPLKVNITSTGNLTDFNMPDSVCVGALVNFKNISSPLPNSSSWNYFSGGPAVVTRDGQYTYFAPGTYAVTLTNTFPKCSGTQTKNIHVVNQPTTTFTGTNIVGCKPPLTSAFTNTTAGATSWSWSFGDGTYAFVQNPPPHTFTSYNNFTVTLTTGSAGGCTSANTLVVKINTPTVKLSNLPAYGCGPYTFTPSATANAVDGVASYSWIFGNGNTSNAAIPPPQTYAAGIYKVYVTITTNGGCQATDSGIVKVGTTKPLTAFSFVPPTACVKSPIQFTDQTPVGTSDQWFWDFGDGNTSTQENPSYSYLKPGIFNVQLKAYKNGCWDTLSHSITVNPPLAGFKFSSPCGQKNNFTFIDISTGPVSTWLWNFNDGSTSASPTPPAHSFPAGPPKTYNVSLTVTNGACSNTVTNPVNANQTTTISFSANPVCINTPITITVAAPGSIVGYLFEFGDGTTATSNIGATSHTYTSPGNFPVKVVTTDSTGCLDSSAVYPMQVNGPLVNFSGTTAISCGADTVHFKDLTTPSNNIKKWSWDFGDGGTSSLQNPVYIYSVQGNFVPKLTVTDNNGCIGSFDTTKPITISIIVPGFTTNDTNYCPISNIRFNNTSTGGFNPTYTWDFKDLSPPSNVVSPSHVYPLVGKYAVTLMMSDIYGCSKTISNPVPINIDTPSATFTMSGNYSACPVFNDSFHFTGHYAKYYAWDFKDGGISQLQNPINGYAIPGDYYPYLIVTSPGGCTAISNSQYVRIDGPAGTFTYSPLAACDSLTVNFNVTTANAFSFTWFFGDGSDSVKTATPAISHAYIIPGQYTPIVYLTDIHGCRIPKIGQNYINIDAITKTSFTADKIIVCDSGVINFTDTSKVGNGTVINNYVWNFGDGSPAVSGQNPTIAHNYTVAGNDSVSMTITTVGGCTNSHKIAVSIAASPQVDIGGIVWQCKPAILNFTGTELVADPNGPLTWSWSFGNGQTSTLQNPLPVSYPKAGDYIIQLIGTNTKGCSDTSDAAHPNELKIYDIPTVYAGADTTICLGGNLPLNATGQAVTYTWLPPVVGNLSCNSCASTLATNVTSSTYFIVNGASLEGCQANDTIDVTVNVPVTVSVSGPDSVCLGQSANLSASGAAIYNWTPSQGLNNPNIANPVATPDASQIGNGPKNVITYLVTGYDNKKCFSDVDSVHVTAFNYPTLQFPQQATINVGSSYPILAIGSSDIVSVNWTPSNTLSCSNCLTPLATPIKTTSYISTAVNGGGCITTDSIRIQVICNGANFFVPNTFSPNGDGVNDQFMVRGVGLNTIPSITIFNRWGQVVFQKSNFAPNDPASGWDGTFNGKPAPPDVYIYTVQIYCDNATLIPYHGNITLIR